MKYKVDNEQWQSIFILQVDLLKDDEKKIELLRNRVIQLERQNRRLKLTIASGDKNPKIGQAFQKTEKAKEFYRSKKWRSLRFNFCMTNERKCKLCGSQTRLHVDHIKPRSLFPELALEPNNLQILCEECNIGKGVSF